MRILLVCFVALFVLGGAACSSHVPPNLSPEAKAAWQATGVVKALDLVRDVAIAANEVKPPLLNEASTRAVVTYHKSALQTIKDVPNGWKAVVETGFTEMLKSLPVDARNLLTPYTDVVKRLLNEVK